MTKEEYQLKYKEITEQEDERKKSLAKDYANSNNPYKIGDIIKDHDRSIKIEDIHYSLYKAIDVFPCCVFYGTELTKKGELNKRGKKRMIYQTNIISKQ